MLVISQKIYETFKYYLEQRRTYIFTCIYRYIIYTFFGSSFLFKKKVIEDL